MKVFTYELVEKIYFLIEVYLVVPKEFISATWLRRISDLISVNLFKFRKIIKQPYPKMTFVVVQCTVPTLSTFKQIHSFFSNVLLLKGIYMYGTYVTHWLVNGLFSSQ